MVGIDRIANRRDNSGLASVSTLSTSARPARRPAALAMSGATILQGPHHAAQKSTMIGTDAYAVAASNSAALRTSTGAPAGGNAALHLPHLLDRSSAEYF